jgi:hypothetical protein
MLRDTVVRIARLGLLPLALGACAFGGGGDAVEDAQLHRHRTLATIVSELQLHLRDDTYRHNRARGEDGQNVFSVALWRLDRLQRALGDEEDADQVSLVIDYARARALERLRRFGDAADAYESVASSGSALAEPAEQAGEIMLEFAAHSGIVGGLEGPDAEIAFLDGRVRQWGSLAWEHRGTPYESLAWEEAEAWAMLRVDWLENHGGPEAAIEPCERLIETHRASKNYPKHLIRLGDLYAETARDHVLSSRAKRDPFDPGRYEQLLDRALSAYELAEDERKPDTRAEATSKIRALLAYHQGVRSYAP